MSIYLCGTEEAFAVCLAQHLTTAPLGILTAGRPPLPAGYAAAALPVTRLAWAPGSDLASLQTCEPIAILCDATFAGDAVQGAGLRVALHELLAADHTLVFAPQAAELAGVDPAASPAHAGDLSAQPPLIPAIVLARIEDDTHVAGLLPPLGAHSRLLALDGPVFVEYTPVERILTVHGAGSALVLEANAAQTETPVAAKAYILTDNMSQHW